MFRLDEQQRSTQSRRCATNSHAGAPHRSVWDFDKASMGRDGCTACIADCYRDSSVMLHFAVSLGDALDEACEGKFLAALKLIASRGNLESLNAVLENVSIRSQLARLG